MNIHTKCGLFVNQKKLCHGTFKLAVFYRYKLQQQERFCPSLAFYLVLTFFAFAWGEKARESANKNYHTTNVTICNKVNIAPYLGCDNGSYLYLNLDL